MLRSEECRLVQLEPESEPLRGPGRAPEQERLQSPEAARGPVAPALQPQKTRTAVVRLGLREPTASTGRPMTRSRGHRT